VQREEKKTIACVEQSLAHCVVAGARARAAGIRSPRNVVLPTGAGTDRGAAAAASPAPARDGDDAAALRLPRIGRLHAAAKRTIDVAIAIAAVVLLAWLLGMVAVLIRLTSRGPVLIRQTRVGRGGRLFTMLKFRTMRADAEREAAPVWPRRNDPRCTPLGRLLRRFGVDELPQLFNVLRGQMSLVGPRPERPCFVAVFAAHLPSYTLRHRVKPGITGWAQVNGFTGDTSIRGRLEHDLRYIGKPSILFDLVILALTPFAVLLNKHA